MTATAPTPQVVLVVDDEAVLRLDASQALHGIGCVTYEAAEAEEALDLLGQHPEISVLFTDINMPGRLDGMELAAEVLRQRPDVHLIITSGRERPAPVDIPDDGQFIAKPYDMETVSGIISGLSRR